MPTGGNKNIEERLKELLDLEKKRLETLEDYKGEFQKLTEHYYTQKTSLEQLRDLQNETLESASKLLDLRKEENKILNMPHNKGRIHDMEKLIKLQKELDELNEGQFASYDKYEKAFDSLYQKIEDQKQHIEDTYEGGIKRAQIVHEEYQKRKSAADEVEKEHYKNLIKEQELLNKRQEEGVTIIDDTNEKLERRTKALKKGVNEITTGVKGIGTSVGKTLEPWRKANHETMAYAKSVGMSQKTADAYLTRTVSWAAKNNIGILFNKSTDELTKLQSKYSEVLGRNVQLTSEQKKDMLAMEAFLGEEGTMDIANNLENFGMGMSDAAEFVKETIDDATKSGIHAAKLTKLVRENIKMAQNYTFKDGLKGLENMAKKAAALKTDMTLVSGLADKVSTVEGAITTGAHLQVLGGTYAAGSDPLSMLYESLNDMEGLFDRAVGMARGKVFYNEETGNFEMGAMDRYLMKQAASSMGVDYTKMTDVAFRQASLGRIENQALMNSNIAGDKDMLELVKNLATFENGRAVIDINGKKVDVGRELNSEHKAQLEQMQMTDSQNLQDMAISLRSMNDILGGTQKEINNEQANATHSIASKLDNMLGNSTKLLNKVAIIGAWGNMLAGGLGVVTGIWGTTNGILRSMYGVRNVFSSRPTQIAGRAPYSYKRGDFKGGLRQSVIQGKNGQMYRQLPNGQLQNVNGGKVISGAARNNILAHGTRTTMATPLGSALSSGLKVGAGMGALSGALTFGVSLASGDDVVRASRKGAVSLAGSIIGGAIGSLIPGGTMIGAMVGGMIAEGINMGISKGADKVRNKVRDSIYNELIATMPNVAQLFSGPNALEGAYRKGQLRRLSEAMSDGTLSSHEIGGGIRKKLRKSGDLDRIQSAGLGIEGIKMEGGGYLDGPSHLSGGMPILGSNITVEGGEYVVNKEATRRNLPLLEKINQSGVKVTPRELLGKQMRVRDNVSFSGASNNNNGKMEVSPISLNINGSIKLDLGGHNIDITKQLLNEPKFITEITNLISKQMNIYDNGAFNKTSFKQKFV